MNKILGIACALFLLTNIQFNAQSVGYAPTNPTNKEVATASSSDIVTFEDPMFEQALADECGFSVGNITVEDMQSLTSLNLGSSNISDISGIEYAINLESLTLYYNSISDIEPISGLENLMKLDLVGNQISDISPLMNLSNLVRLYLSENQISDISALSSLSELRKLDLYDNDISDISALSDLTNLRYVELSYNLISDISALLNLTNLEILAITNNQVTNISSLSELNNLTALYLSNNKIGDISPLSGLNNLTILHLNNNEISNISALSGLTNINDLNLSNNRIQDISPLLSILQSEKLDQIVLDNQNIILDDLDVDNKDEVFGSVITENSTPIVISLGIPIFEENDLFNSFNYPFDFKGSSGVSSATYSGKISQIVTYINPLSGNDSVSITEEKAMDDDQLISLFNIYDSSDYDVEVDQSLIDYNKPGVYQVNFTDSLNNEFNGELTIIDMVPTLNIDSSQINIKLNSTLDDVISQLNISATEVNEGDLTGSIIIDDSDINYNQIGTYNLKISVSDEEGNRVTETVKVTVEADEPVIEPVDPLEPTTNPDSENDVLIDSSTDVDSEKELLVDENSENDTRMSVVDGTYGLATTGSSTVIVTITFTIVSASLIATRLFLSRK